MGTSPRAPARRAAVLALLLSGVLCLPAAAAGTEPAEEETAAPPGLAAASARLNRAWWNQERYVEALALSDEQRHGMDRALVEHLAARRELAGEVARRRRLLGAKLAAGDWEGAEEAAAAVAAAHAALGRGEAELATAVARLLSDEQRRKVAAEFPRLLDRPVVVGGVGGRFGRGLRPGARRPGPPDGR